MSQPVARRLGGDAEHGDQTEDEEGSGEDEPGAVDPIDPPRLPLACGWSGDVTCGPEHDG